MTEQKHWNGQTVRTWLESRSAAARSEQDRADRGGRACEGDYDKAAAEEYVCRLLRTGGAADDQARFAQAIKTLLDKDDYLRPGVHDDRRFEREVRGYLRKLAKMTKTDTGFENLLRHQ